MNEMNGFTEGFAVGQGMNNNCAQVTAGRIRTRGVYRLVANTANGNASFKLVAGPYLAPVVDTATIPAAT